MSGQALRDYAYGSYPVMEKRPSGVTGGRPSLSDYLRLAALQYEMDKEEAEAADANNAESNDNWQNWTKNGQN